MLAGMCNPDDSIGFSHTLFDWRTDKRQAENVLQAYYDTLKYPLSGTVIHMASIVIAICHLH